MRGTDVAGALHPCLLRLLRARPRIPSTVLLVLAAAAPSPLYLRAASSMPPNRSEYQPLAQSVDEEEDVSEGLNPQPARGLRRAQRPISPSPFSTPIPTPFHTQRFLVSLRSSCCLPISASVSWSQAVPDSSDPILLIG